MTGWPLLLAGLALTTGCALEQGGLGRAPMDLDASSMGERDSSMARFDAGASDAGAILDSGLVGRPDGDGVPLVDAGAPDSGSTPGSCDDRYEGLGLYELCEERATECEFFVQLSGSSCGEICGSRGGECIRTYHEDDDGNCIRDGDPRTCGQTFEDEICICSR